MHVMVYNENIMCWIFVTISAYFLGALAIILDKYLLTSEKISTPAVYAFYVGVLGLGVLLFSPLGFFFGSFVLKIPTASQFWLSMESGILFLFAIMALYFAVKKSQASKVTPVFYSVIPMVTFILAYFSGLEIFSWEKELGIGLLIVGGLLISFDLPLRLNKKKFFAGFYLSLLAGTLMGVSTYLLKLVYQQQNFYNGYVWTRLGAFLGTLMLLAVPTWNKQISKSIFTRRKKSQRKENLKTGGIFVVNKIIGGSSSALINLAIGLGSVTLINSLVSLQYVFVLVIAVLLAKKLPHIFEERLLFWDWAQKIGAIVIIAGGMFLISR